MSLCRVARDRSALHRKDAAAIYINTMLHAARDHAARDGAFFFCRRIIGIGSIGYKHILAVAVNIVGVSVLCLRAFTPTVAQREVAAAFDHDNGAAARARQNIAVQAQRHRAGNGQGCRQLNVGGKIVIAARKLATLCKERRPVRAVFGVDVFRRVRRAGAAGQKNGERQSRAQRRQRRKQPQDKFMGIRSVFHTVSLLNNISTPSVQRL